METFKNFGLGRGSRKQFGSITLSPRKQGPAVWILRIRMGTTKKSIQLGTIQELPSKALAITAAEHLRSRVNNPELARAIEEQGDRYERKDLPHGCKKGRFDAMIVAQAGRCMICGSLTKMCVDHNHETGKIRDLLCGYCNRGLGMFRDNPALLRAAAIYLDKHNKVGL